MGITSFILCSTQWLFWLGSRWLTLIYTIVDSVADRLKNMDMAVFCMDKNSELVTFTESKLGSVSTCIILVYYINTSEIPSEFSCENFISSHVTRSPLSWLHNKSRLFHWCLYNKQNITSPFVDMNFIFSCSTRYPMSEHRKRARYWVEHENIKFASMRGRVISSIYFAL